MRCVHAGDLTLQLRDWLSALFPASLVVSLGVDVDGELIARAAKKRDGCQRTAFAAADVMQPDFCRVVREWEAGHDARRDASDRADAAAASSPACQVPPAARTVRIVSLFSVTMWVHLNHGDEGLAHLLQTVSRWADVLILEPQPWKCYSTAARRLRRMGLAPHERLASLRWREAQLPAAVHRTLTQECGMDGFSDMGVSEAWKRAVLLYWHEPRRWEMAAGEVPASEGDSACPAARQTGLDTAGDTACKVHTRGREDAAAAGSEPEADTIAARTKRRRT